MSNSTDQNNCLTYRSCLMCDKESKSFDIFCSKECEKKAIKKWGKFYP